MATTTTTSKGTFQAYLLADICIFVRGLEVKAQAHRMALEADRLRHDAALINQLSDSMLSGAFRHPES